MAPSRKPAPEPVAAALRAFLDGHPGIDRLRVALSGGRDSVVLLHALAQCDSQRRALPLHVHHGLHPLADAQAEQCRRVADALGYRCRVLEVRVPERPGEGVEAAARRLRYQALARGAAAGDCILTAHHAADQAETFLLAALKGSGPAGLAAMPRMRRIGPCWLGRPLLDVPGAAIAAYALAQALPWIEDPSNADPRFDRNFLRREVLPRLAGRFPVERRLGVAAGLQAEVADVLDGLLDPVLDGFRGPCPDCLDLGGFLQQPVLRRPWLLRRFITRAGAEPPRRRQLLEFLRQLEQAASDASPALHWDGHSLRVYRGALYLLAAAEEAGSEPPRAGFPWPRGAEELHLPDGRVLTRRELGEAGVTDPAGVSVRFRRGGERLRQPDGTRRALKNLMQEHAIPPWRRARVPLIERDGELIAVLWSR
ncbi:MAG: tRNA lysidine(34) synthetase TilS [Thioalkalivibrio sp.]|nr:MAG: tRNA lysidine(34) synthetase TilS [Thioalkalivibrio sp.]